MGEKKKTKSKVGKAKQLIQETHEGDTMFSRSGN